MAVPSAALWHIHGWWQSGLEFNMVHSEPFTLLKWYVFSTKLMYQLKHDAYFDVKVLFGTVSSVLSNPNLCICLFDQISLFWLIFETQLSTSINSMVPVDKLVTIIPIAWSLRWLPFILVSSPLNAGVSQANMGTKALYPAIIDPKIDLLLCPVHSVQCAL